VQCDLYNEIHGSVFAMLSMTSLCFSQNDSKEVFVESKIIKFNLYLLLDEGC